VRFLVGFLLAWVASTAIAQEIVLPGGARGGPLAHREPLDHHSDAWRAEVQAEIDRNIAALLANGAIAPATKAAGQLFQWPVRLIPGAPDRVPNILVNYVDQNPAYPGQVRDWFCGTRTYDLANGYGHRGTDISAFPFGWLKMDRDEMIAIAAAPGTIILRTDGNFDRNCGTLATVPTNAQPNAIYVRHADGSVAWYLHFKSGSLTPKQVGDTVVAGERLASVGSSGFSTGPHLHFEVHDAAGGIIDPYAGACNVLNADSWWATQPAYWQPAVVRNVVGPEVPQGGDCATPALPHASRTVTPGSTFYATTYLRDFLTNATVQLRILQPDGTAFVDAPVTNTLGNYIASYWYYQFAMPPDAQVGTWRFQAVLGDATAETPFYVEPLIPPTTTAVEYYNAGFGHYFMTAKADEIAGLDGGAYNGAFARTHRTFEVFSSPGTGLVPVCRFFTTPGTFGAKSSHFYTANPVECDGLKLNPAWIYETIAFYVPMPDGAGTCPANSLPVYRMYNNGQTGAPNHRFTTDYATKLAFAPALNWSDEGVGFCAPQ
jgi:murein DD-endopeptidase MepM/ murein hydrolase activator NlpD